MNLIWFRNDLRIHDNEALAEACKDTSNLLPVYIFDPIQHEKSSFGFTKTGGFRLQFLIDSLQNLNKNLIKKGSGLILEYGDSVEILTKLVKEFNVQKVFLHEEVTSEETDVEDHLVEVLEEIGVEVKSFWGATLFHADDLPFEFDNIPEVFTAFRKKVEKYARVRPLIPVPKFIPPLPKGINKNESLRIKESFFSIALKKPSLKSVLSFDGGEDAGLNRLEEYIWKGDHLKNYKETRNGMLGADYSSKFSAWLANGSISPRKIYHEVRRYESERISNDSTYWMIFELIWRDYFRFIHLKHGDKFFYINGLKGEATDWSQNEELFNAWKDGNTGIPFVDANMRELNETGFMSNRGRQNVASFLSKNLNIDWRMGAEYFESVLIDYDVCSNWGNWAYVAGVGNDPRDRYFNIVGQAQRYDTNGEYIKFWLPELESISLENLHTPLKENNAIKYPSPIINLDKSYDEIKKRYS